MRASVARRAPNGLNQRLNVGWEVMAQGSFPGQLVWSSASASCDDEEQTAREFAGVMIPVWWSREQVADQLLSALPPVEPNGDDPASALWLRQLFDLHRGAGTLPLTDDEGGAWG